jgi:hypothetical protein
VPRTILGPTLVIGCALALMPLLVRPTTADQNSADHALADAIFRANSTRAAQVPAASFNALAAMR